MIANRFLNRLSPRHVARQLRYFGNTKTVTTALIKELRQQSGSPIKECKKALEASNGDVEEAWNYLRKMGQATAMKKSGNTTAHGLISVSVEGERGGIFQMASETDFVENNPKLQDLTFNLASLARQGEEGVLDLDAFRTKDLSGRSVADSITDLVGSIRENLQVKRGHTIAVKEGVVAAYIHNKLGENCGLKASLVGLESSGDKDQLLKLGRELAMHVVANAPQPKYLKSTDVPQEVLDKERDILTAQLTEEGKPADMITKIVDGRIRKFSQEVALMDQSFCLEDDNVSVQKVVQRAEKELGCSISVSDFVVYNMTDSV